jgi:hypothetical protein
MSSGPIFVGSDEQTQTTFRDLEKMKWVRASMDCPCREDLHCMAMQAQCRMSDCPFWYWKTQC